MPDSGNTPYNVGRFLGQFSSQINTLLLIIAILGVGYTYATREGATSKRIDDLDIKVERLIESVDTQDRTNQKKWEDHMNLHKERQVDLAAQNSRADERINQVVADLRKFDELSYKQTQTETNVTNLQSSIKELSATVNTQSTNLQVMQQILQRIETKVTRGSPLD